MFDLSVEIINQFEMESEAETYDEFNMDEADDGCRNSCVGFCAGSCFGTCTASCRLRSR